MIKIDYSLIIQMVNFLFLIWILNLLVFRPIRGILTQRSERFNNLAKDIESCRRDAEEKETAFAQGIKDARNRGVKEKEAFIAEAEAEEKKLMQEINAKAQANLAEIRGKIQKDAASVAAALEKEIDEFAKAIGQKILGRAV